MEMKSVWSVRCDTPRANHAFMHETPSNGYITKMITIWFQILNQNSFSEGGKCESLLCNQKVVSRKPQLHILVFSFDAWLVRKQIISPSDCSMAFVRGKGTLPDFFFCGCFHVRARPRVQVLCQKTKMSSPVIESRNKIFLQCCPSISRNIIFHRWADCRLQ